MSEPTKAVIEAALKRAQFLVTKKNLDLLNALAQATTTPQCDGVASYKVFRDARQAVQRALPTGTSVHEVTGKPAELVALLESARQVLT